MVDVPQEQHCRGHVLSERTLRLASGGLKEAPRRRALRDALRQVGRMYEAREAREDTMLFPAFARLVYAALGEDFENDLAKFTPRA